MEAALNSSLGRMQLGQIPLRIGRAPDNTVVINDPQASAHHVEVTPGFGNNGYQIIDLGSTNGTFVNEQRLTANMPRPLYAGDTIRIGTTSFTYEASGAGYESTVASNAPNYEPTIAAAPGAFPPPAQPSYPQSPAAFGNVNAPGQAPYTPSPSGYPQPQPGYPQTPSVYPQSQPGYPQPGTFGQPGYPPERKSRTGLWVTLVLILLLLVGTGGTFAYFQLRSTPQKTLAAYCDGWKTNNAQELYDTLSSDQQAKTSVSKIQRALGLVTLVGGIKDCTVNSVTENGSTATGNVTIVPNRGPAGNVNLSLVNENGTWKIADSGNRLPNQ